MIPTTWYILQSQLCQLQNSVCGQLDRRVALHGMKEEGGEEVGVRVKGTKGRNKDVDTRRLAACGLEQSAPIALRLC